MAINKLPEFAKDGQKNTDDLVLTDGFPVLKKPARQWFNWLFNILSLKINEVIDNKIDYGDIADNLTTDDASKPLSAAQGKKLQDEKFAKNDLINDLITGGVDKALTAEQGKLLLSKFASLKTTAGYLKLPTADGGQLILQWGFFNISHTGAQKYTGNITFPITFPNSVLNISVTHNDLVNVAKISASRPTATQTSFPFAADFGVPVTVGGNMISFVAIGY